MTEQTLNDHWTYYAKEMAEYYLTCAAWSTPDYSENGETLSEELSGCWSDAAEKQAVKECTAFIEAAKDLLEELKISAESAGHDLWLTSQGHGTGFWDRGYPSAKGRKLTELAKQNGCSDHAWEDLDGVCHLSDEIPE